jgi:hypothetical protein
LQTNQKSSLETKELTTSFGWDSNEAYDQHDVQELCRVMFDALEQLWRKSSNSKTIQDLYEFFFNFNKYFNLNIFQGNCGRLCKMFKL